MAESAAKQSDDYNGAGAKLRALSFITDEDAWEILEEFYEEIFPNELGGWHTDPEAWPQNRTFEMFQQWFHVEFHSVVEDLCDDELFDEDSC